MGSMIIDHEPVTFTSPDDVYFNSRPLAIPAAPYDIEVAHDDDGRIIAANGSPFENYRAWMEMALEAELYDLATELVMEMAAGEELAAQRALPDPPDNGRPKPKRPRPMPPRPRPGVPSGA